MAVNRQNKPDIHKSSQQIQNTSYDEELGVSVVAPVGYDGQFLQRPNAENVARKVVAVGNITYMCIAAPGTPQATAKWQCQKIDESVTGTAVTTWAEGNADFSHTATDPTSHTYS